MNDDLNMDLLYIKTVYYIFFIHTFSIPLMLMLRWGTLEMGYQPTAHTFKCFLLGRKSEYSEENPKAQREHAKSTHTGQRLYLNSQPQRCEVTELRPLV